MSAIPPFGGIPPRPPRRPIPWRAIVAAIVTLLAIAGVVTVTDDDHDGRPDHATIKLPFVPAPSTFDANPPGGLPAAEDDIPGVPERVERKLEKANDDAVDEPYDTSGVLQGAAGQGAEFVCYTSQNGGPRPISDIGLGVVHVTVSGNRGGTSDGFGLCDFFRRIQASPTWTVDNEGHSWENVPLTRVPWTQAWYNRRSCSVEFVGSTGRPGEGAAEWTLAQYREGARLIAGCFAQAHIPPRWGAVTAGGLIVRTGLITHQELGRLGGGHTDPGPRFNRALFRSLVAGYMAGGKPITASARAKCHRLSTNRRHTASYHRRHGLKPVEPQSKAKARKSRELAASLRRGGYKCPPPTPGKRVVLSRR